VCEPFRITWYFCRTKREIESFFALTRDNNTSTRIRPLRPRVCRSDPDNYCRAGFPFQTTRYRSNAHPGTVHGVIVYYDDLEHELGFTRRSFLLGTKTRINTFEIIERRNYVCISELTWLFRNPVRVRSCIIDQGTVFSITNEYIQRVKLTDRSLLLFDYLRFVFCLTSASWRRVFAYYIKYMCV